MLWLTAYKGNVHGKIRSFLLFFLLIGFTVMVHGQDDFVIIDSINIVGLKITQRNVILKEIDFTSGDTIGLKELAKRMSSNEKRLQSIGLFTVAKINVKNWNTDLSICDLEIKVQENWYIYPYIIFELADRNFNVWRKEQKYSFDRVNYGVALNHINLTGNKDKLKLKFQRGYTRKYEIAYDFPYLKKRWGLSANLLYAENREIAYKTFNNKPQFYQSPDEKKLFFQHRASISLLNRTSALLHQSLRFEFISAKIDTIINTQLNPSFFGNNTSSLQYFLVDYYLRFDNTVYPLYPMAGYRVEFNARKEGLGLLSDTDNAWLSFSTELHSPLLKWLILSNRLKFKINLQDNNLPYFLNNAIGYKSDNITGYQLYVLDGRNFILLNNALRFRLIDKDIIINKYMPKQFREMNTKLFLRLSFDYGYARDPLSGSENPYSNRNEYGYGPGLDLILYNNFTLSFEYGITRFNEKGFFIESGFNF